MNVGWCVAGNLRGTEPNDEKDMLPLRRNKKEEITTLYTDGGKRNARYCTGISVLRNPR